MSCILLVFPHTCATSHETKPFHCTVLTYMQMLLRFICNFCQISCLRFTLTQRQRESSRLCSSVFTHAFSACALLCMLVNRLNCRGSLNHRQSKNKQIHQRCLTGHTVSSSSLCNAAPVTESQLQELRLPQTHYGSCY